MHLPGGQPDRSPSLDPERAQMSPSCDHTRSKTTRHRVALVMMQVSREQIVDEKLNYLAFQLATKNVIDYTFFIKG